MLDFTALKNDAPKSPTTHGNDPAHIKVPAELKSEPAAVAAARYKENRQNAQEMNLLEVSKLINERLRNCQTAIWAYNKAVRDDRPPEEIAVLAAKALSLSVSEELIYTSIEKKYRQKYGIRVSNATPYDIIRESPENALTK